MAAVLGRTEIQVKKTGSTTTVHNTPIAKLMYYFDCISSCVEPDEDYTIRRLRNYKENYSRLSSEEEAQLLVLCLALSPDKLIGTILFPTEDIDGSSNEFYEVSAVSTKLVVAESLLIGGQQKRIRKVMMCKKVWLENYYLDPLRSIGNRQRALPSPVARQRREESSCIIL